jgi:hypothetical protein
VAVEGAPTVGVAGGGGGGGGRGDGEEGDPTGDMAAPLRVATTLRAPGRGGYRLGATVRFPGGEASLTRRTPPT